MSADRQHDRGTADPSDPARPPIAGVAGARQLQDHLSIFPSVDRQAQYRLAFDEWQPGLSSCLRPPALRSP
jgi:hypothetical protein